jgi:hypothetical protein
MCHDSLYPIPASYPVKFIFKVNKISIIRWHDHLVHPYFQIVQRILREFSLPYEQESNKDYVCGPYQQAKSHQLPYLKSNSVSSHPLELIFFMFRSAPEFVDRNKYYVSFVDDYNRFTWIYLLKFKSEVIQKF